MAIKTILLDPNEILHTKCEQVTNFDDETKVLIQDLLDTARAAKDPEAAGLAAPQIGVLKRICIVRRFVQSESNENDVTIHDYVLVNPQIIKTSSETSKSYEGCLSIPDFYAKVERPKKVKIRALNEHGQEIQINTSGFFARVIQHEIDHLDGILMTDKALGNLITEEEFDKLHEEDFEK